MAFAKCNTNSIQTVRQFAPMEMPVALSAQSLCCRNLRRHWDRNSTTNNRIVEAPSALLNKAESMCSSSLSQICMKYIFENVVNLGRVCVL